MLSGSRSTTTVPIGDSTIGLNGMPFSARRSCQVSDSSRDDTANAMWVKTSAELAEDPVVVICVLAADQ